MKRKQKSQNKERMIDIYTGIVLMFYVTVGAIVILTFARTKQDEYKYCYLCAEKCSDKI